MFRYFKIAFIFIIFLICLIESHDKNITKANSNDRINGIAIKQPVNVYESPSRKARVIKTYDYNHPLIYRTYSEDWHIATVYINGKSKTGYIHHADVSSPQDAPAVKGIALTKTNVYSSTSNKSKILKTYTKGSILKYRAYNKNWLTATVYLKGKPVKGYIPAKNVETILSNQQTLKGIGIKKHIPVYGRASTNSKILKNYQYGHILKIKTFTNDWHEATIYLKNKAHKGYIRKQDVKSNLNDTLNGYAQSNPTVVYSKPSKSSKKLKSYKIGKRLKYKSYTSNWFKATVYVNGKARTGYIYTKDVSPNAPQFTGYAIANKTYVYSKAARKSSKLKSYNRGHVLKYRPYNNNWHKVTVYLNGKAKTGYISVHDIGSKTQLNKPLYINGILIVNKQFPLPANYKPGENSTARKAFNRMAKDAKKSGFHLTAFSTYRSYAYQKNLFNRYAKVHGVKAANRFSAKPGQSEHQTGLAFDVGEVGKTQHWANDSFGKTKASKWIAQNAHKYGFIVRYPKGKEHITGYKYEPWHLRYVGVKHATDIYNRGITLEEYLGLY